MNKLSLIILGLLVTGQVWAGNIVGATQVYLIAGDYNYGAGAPPYLPIGTSTNNTPITNAVRTLDQVYGLGSNTTLTASKISLSADTIYYYPYTTDTYFSAYLYFTNSILTYSNCFYRWTTDIGHSTQPAAWTNAYNLYLGMGCLFIHRPTLTNYYMIGDVSQASSVTLSLINSNHNHGFLTYYGQCYIGNPYPVTKTLDDLLSTNVVGVKPGPVYVINGSNSADFVGFYNISKIDYDLAWLNDNTGSSNLWYHWVYSNGTTVALASSTNTFDMIPGKTFLYFIHSNFNWTVTNPFQ